MKLRFRPKFKNHGFTLVEMIIYVAIAAIAIGIIVAFILWTIQIGARAKNNYAVSNNARRALEIIAYEIKKSQSIYTPTSVFDNPQGQLSLQQPAPTDSDETLTYVDIFRCGDGLCLKKEGALPQNLINNQVKVTELSFTPLFNSSNAISIQIDIHLESLAQKASQPVSAINLTTTANLNSY